MSFNKKNISNAKIGFRNKCLYILVEAYKAMKEKGSYSISWEEEDLTAQLICFAERNLYCTKWKIHIIPERRLYTTEIVFGEISAKHAPRIDMQMLSWQNKQKDIYHIEAKNLCETDWIKDDGSKVNASHYLNRFVETGVMHIKSGYYPINSCLCGYILQGSTENIIQKINEILEKKSFKKLELTIPINNHKLFYIIEIECNKLLNLFLELN